MKNIMILGICRTGKTTFSRIIQKEFPNYQIIEVDTIIAALQKIIGKEVPIGFIHDKLNDNRLPQFLNLLIQKNIAKNGKYLGFVINADSIMPEDLIKNFDLSNTLVYYFVNSSLNPKEILENCRKHDDMLEWTTKKDDNFLLNHFEFYKTVEPKIIEECKKYGFKCIDTSYNRNQIFKNLIKEIKVELRKEI